MNREEVNERLRNSFNSILNHKPTGKELARRKEIEEIARKEKEDYEKKKKDFYDNPLHLDNNKRRRQHLSMLRGSINKNRSKRYHLFHPTAHICCLIEDVIDDVLTDNLKNNEFFNQFVDVKDLNIGDKNLLFVEET